METIKDSLTVSYLIRRVGAASEAKIFQLEKEVGEIRKGEGVTYALVSKSGETFLLDPRVHGEIRPFSLTIRRAGRSYEGGTGAVLTIRDHLFQHNGKFYMLTNSPEGMPLRNFLLGKRYISRLENFPFTNLSEVDYETRSRLRMFRGVCVGEMEGLGTDGHRVKLSRELEGIGLPLSATCYLLYATG